MSPTTFRRIALVAWIFQALIVLSGAAVRLTEAGLGCEDWPRCNEDRLTPEWELHGWIEFGNRLISLVVTLTTVCGDRRGLPPSAEATRPDHPRLAPRRRDGGPSRTRRHHRAPRSQPHRRLRTLPVVDGPARHRPPALAAGRSGRSGHGEPNHRRDDPPPAPGPVAARRPRTADGDGGHRLGTTQRRRQCGSSRLRTDVGGQDPQHHRLAVVGLPGRTGLRLRNEIDREPGDRRSHRWPILKLLAIVAVGQAAVGYTQFALGVPALLVELHVAGAVGVWMLAVALHLRSFDNGGHQPDQPVERTELGVGAGTDRVSVRCALKIGSAAGDAIGFWQTGCHGRAP